MRTEKSFVGAVVLDSYPFSSGGTARQALEMKATGVDAVVGYLGVITADRVKMILDAGLAFMPVTTAKNFRMADYLVAQIQKLGLSSGCTAWLDLEGEPFYNEGKADPLGLMKKINASAFALRDKAGMNPGAYFAPPQPLTSEEMFSLVVTRYWKGMGSIRDRFNKLAEPTCGWCMTQMYHGVKDAMGMMWRDLDPAGGSQRLWKQTDVFVDPNMIGSDFYQRLPNWVVA